MSVVRTLIGNVKGPKGDTGATGATGAAGADGAAATIEVGTVTTGAYGTNASVTNSGTESEAIFDFVIPQGAPGEEVTDASDLTLNEITASSANYPTFTVQEQLKGIFGKIQKFLSDLKSNYVSKSMMSTSTNIGTPGEAVADAVAIKSLNDALTDTRSLIMSGILPDGTDFNDVVTPGCYFISSSNTYTNTPGTVYTLCVYRHSLSGTTILQVAWNVNRIYFRFRTSATTWQNKWRVVEATTVD